MIKLEITGVHIDLDAKIKKYVTAKINRLEKYMPKHARESAHAEIFLKEKMIKAKKECSCEVVLHLPKGTIRVEETTMNMYAAVDIVEAKLKNLLKKYKETHSSLRIHKRVIAKFRRSTVIE
ncbi:ribosome-associated translation inhibitor RaiA [Candidatus Saccharibacteria bacterium]|nr:ribosome-associated translation inhibitor RaiA [Candidatus Saccharibacteria bacterium]